MKQRKRLIITSILLLTITSVVSIYFYVPTSTKIDIKGYTLTVYHPISYKAIKKATGTYDYEIYCFLNDHCKIDIKFYDDYGLVDKYVTNEVKDSFNHKIDYLQKDKQDIFVYIVKDKSYDIRKSVRIIKAKDFTLSIETKTHFLDTGEFNKANKIIKRMKFSEEVR